MASSRSRDSAVSAFLDFVDAATDDNVSGVEAAIARLRQLNEEADLHPLFDMTAEAYIKVARSLGLATIRAFRIGPGVRAWMCRRRSS